MPVVTILKTRVHSRTYCQRVFKDCKLQTCYVQSPAYPGVYPRSLHCTYQLSTRLPFIKLYIENEEFNVDGQRCENIITCPMRPIFAGDYAGNKFLFSSIILKLAGLSVGYFQEYEIVLTTT